MSEPPPGRPAWPAGEDLVAAVRRAAGAGIPVAIVDLLGPGAAFAASRGDAGTRYAPGEAVVHELSGWGAGALDGGLSLYPAPEPGTRRVVVLLLEGRNWLPHEEGLERAVADAVRAVESPPDERS